MQAQQRSVDVDPKIIYLPPSSESFEYLSNFYLSFFVIYLGNLELGFLFFFFNFSNFYRIFIPLSSVILSAFSAVN